MNNLKVNDTTVPDVHEIVGDFGKWQKQIFVLFFMLCVVNTWQNLNISFLAPNIEFKCISPLPSNSSNLVNVNENISNFENHTVSKDQCKINLDNTSIPCEHWEYELEAHQRTIVSDWNLVCNREWLISFSKSIYMIGYMISILLMGHLADWFGRFPVIMVSYIISTVSTVLASASSSYAMFATMRFFAGFGKTGVTSTGFVLITEIVGPNWRAELGNGMMIGSSIGYMILPGIAWLLQNWVYLQLASGLPMLLLIVGYWIVSESPRWLLTQRKWDKFDKVISDAAKKNNHIIDEDIKNRLKQYQKVNSESDIVKKKTIVDVLKSPDLRIRFILLLYIWIVNSFIYYEITFNTNDLAGNFYLNFFLLGLVEVPGVMIFTFAIRKFGRRKPLCGGMIITGIFCGLIIAVPKGLTWLTITLAMVAKLCITGTYQTVYLCTTELFPTVVRTTTLGYCSTFARFGPILAPFVRDLAKATHKNVPDILNAILSITAGLLVLFFPETKDQRIPDNLETDNTIKKENSTKKYSNLKESIESGINN